MKFGSFVFSLFSFLCAGEGAAGENHTQRRRKGVDLIKGVGSFHAARLIGRRRGVSASTRAESATSFDRGRPVPGHRTTRTAETAAEMTVIAPHFLANNNNNVPSKCVNNIVHTVHRWQFNEFLIEMF